MSPGIMEILDGERVGFRAWTLGVNGDLKSFRGGVPWTPGENEAACLCNPGYARTLLEEHRAPVVGCMCGLHAWHDLDAANSYAEGYVAEGGQAKVLGVVSGWGKMCLHSDGFRAEYARVHALVLEGGEIRQGWIRKAAQRYGVPALAKTELLGLAGEFGDVVPEELRPEPVARGQTFSFTITSFTITLTINNTTNFIIWVGGGQPSNPTTSTNNSDSIIIDNFTTDEIDDTGYVAIDLGASWTAHTPPKKKKKREKPETPKGVRPPQVTDNGIF